MYLKNTPVLSTSGLNVSMMYVSYLTFRSVLVLRSLHCAKFISARSKRHSKARSAKADESGRPERPECARMER